MLGQNSGVARAMQDANDHKLALVMHVIDGVIAGETDAQARRKMLTRGRGERKMPQRLAIAFDLVNEPPCRRLGGFDGNVEPNLREVGFCRVGQAEGERSANSFLPRAMILSASKSFTRPAATSANPLSMSVLSAASSSI